MRKKIRFYKALLVEIIETLCSICLYLEADGRRNHIYRSDELMRDHFCQLKNFSKALREADTTRGRR